jgi:predicted metal-binding protein
MLAECLQDDFNLKALRKFAASKLQTKSVQAVCMSVCKHAGMVAQAIASGSAYPS